MALFPSQKNNSKNTLPTYHGYTTTFVDSLKTILSTEEQDDLGYGTCRNCGVRPADNTNGKCFICRSRGY